jgi:hypothetical protein
MNLSKLSFISMLAATAVDTAFAATTGGLRHQPIETPGEEFVIALSDVANKDSAAHHVLDASDIFIDAGLDECVAKGEYCDEQMPCCDGEEYNLSNILTTIIFVLLISSHVSSSCVSSLLVINSCFLSVSVCSMFQCQ